jgi:subtilase family serine protease
MVDNPEGSSSEALRPDPGLDAFEAKPPHHVRGNAGTSPYGLTPAQVRAVYNLPSTGGFGTIAIVDAYDSPTAESDLNVFSAQYGLPACTTANGCFTKHMVGKVRADSGWALEIALDIQWAHAIAPNAKILLVEAKSASGNDLLAAVDYARGRSDVVAISMSWGGGEFSTETASDFHFTSAYGATFFASSGDNGTGASWPACSPNIVSVGGTKLNFNADGSLASETAWSGSGGGVSKYVPMPAFQSTFGLTGGKRLIPDVSYNGDPASGVSVYDSYSYQGQKGWFAVGGTSAGSPQWAAIKSLGLSASNAFFYQDAAGINAASYFRDIASGTNGTCGAVCTAAPGYDTVTGLGSPLTTTY